MSLGLRSPSFTALDTFLTAEHTSSREVYENATFKVHLEGRKMSYFFQIKQAF